MPKLVANVNSLRQKLNDPKFDIDVQAAEKGNGAAITRIRKVFQEVRNGLGDARKMAIECKKKKAE